MDWTKGREKILKPAILMLLGGNCSKGVPLERRTLVVQQLHQLRPMYIHVKGQSYLAASSCRDEILAVAGPLSRAVAEQQAIDEDYEHIKEKGAEILRPVLIVILFASGTTLTAINPK